MDMEINFPNLGIYLDHVGKNISIFGFSIAYYGIVIVTGMMIAIWIAQREAKRTGQNPEQYLDLAMIGIAAGILGARIYYVIFAWDYYKDDLLSIFNIRQGGLAIYGGIIGGFLFGGLACKWRKVPVLPIFQLIQKAGNIPERDMFNTFNMGVGLCVAVSKETAQAALEAFRNAGEEAVLLGEVIEGDEGVVLW